MRLANSNENYEKKRTMQTIGGLNLDSGMSVHFISIAPSSSGLHGVNRSSTSSSGIILCGPVTLI